MRQRIHRVVGAAAFACLLLAASGIAPRSALAKLPAPTSTKASPAKKAIPTMALQKLGSTHLEGVDGNEALISGFSAFDMDDRGRFGFLKGCGCERTFLQVDSDGKQVRKIVLPKPLDERQTERKAIWIRGDQWLVVASNDVNGGKSTAQWVDTSTGNVTDIAGFTAPPVKALAGTHDGGFVALVNIAPASSEGGEQLALMAFERLGRKLWTVRSSGGNLPTMPRIPDGARLMGAEGLTVTRGGQIVVLGAAGHRLEVYGRDGSFRRNVPLDRKSDSPGGYGTRVDDDGAGGVTVSGRDAPTLRLGIDRTAPAETWNLLSPEGHPIQTEDGVIAAPDGRLWTSDGYSFLRLDSHGKADRVVGEPFDPDHLRSIADLAATRSGRIYALDERTHAVHVFDAEGKRLQVDSPARGDGSERTFGSAMVVSDGGDVYVRQESGHGGELLINPSTSFVHFTPGGRRTGIESGDVPGDHAHQWVAQSGTANRWVLSFEAIYLVDPHGSVLLKVDKDANRQALHPVDAIGSAPDGSLAVLAFPEDSLRSGAVRNGESAPGLELVKVSATGAIAGHWPTPIQPYDGKMGFDGTHIAWAKRESSTSPAILIADAHGQPLYQFKLPAKQEMSGVYLANHDGAQELWIFDGKSTIDRYRLP